MSMSITSQSKPLLLELYKSRDSQEARDAFVEKRDADFKDEN